MPHTDSLLGYATAATAMLAAAVLLRGAPATPAASPAGPGDVVRLASVHVIAQRDAEHAHVASPHRPVDARLPHWIEAARRSLHVVRERG